MNPIHLNPLYTAVSWVLLRWHQLLTFIGLNTDSGLTWGLSIVLLVVTARLLLFRFFIKQVHYQRQMQELQPQLQKIREKYKSDRRQQQQEMMKFQQEHGFNPIAGCLPMVLQIPVFISLFHVLRHLANSAHLKPGSHNLTIYGFTQSETYSAAKAKLFGAPLATSFHDPVSKIASLDGDVSSARIITMILVIISAAATYITQRQVMKNATTPAEGTAATIQRASLYMIPFFVLVSGFVFPLGVLLYWFTSNLWTMGQQFYIFKFHPHTPTVSAAAALATEVRDELKPAPGAKPIRPDRPVRGGSGKAAVEGGDSAGGTGSAKKAAPSSNGSSREPKDAGKSGNGRSRSPKDSAGTSSNGRSRTPKDSAGTSSNGATGDAAPGGPRPRGRPRPTRPGPVRRRGPAPDRRTADPIRAARSAAEVLKGPQ